MTAGYESDDVLARYLLLHYGAPAEITPFGDVLPEAALRFPPRCVTETIAPAELPDTPRAWTSAAPSGDPRSSWRASAVKSWPSTRRVASSRRRGRCGRPAAWPTACRSKGSCARIGWPPCLPASTARVSGSTSPMRTRCRWPSPLRCHPGRQPALPPARTAIVPGAAPGLADAGRLRGVHDAGHLAARFHRSRALAGPLYGPASAAPSTRWPDCSRPWPRLSSYAAARPAARHSRTRGASTSSSSRKRRPGVGKPPDTSGCGLAPGLPPDSPVSGR